jgi:hypothetical protein
MINKTRLYILVIVLLIAGYIWFSYNIFVQNNDSTGKGFNLCPIKSVTDIPCPSCGSTRSLMEIFHGNFVLALNINPLGYIIALLMMILPFWISYDLIRKRSSFHFFYIKTEKFISYKFIASLLIVLILINWCWNISKGL